MDNFYTKYVFVLDLLTGKNVLQRNILGGKINFATLSTPATLSTTNLPPSFKSQMFRS